jgi:hypothetical protein
MELMINGQTGVDVEVSVGGRGEGERGRVGLATLGVTGSVIWGVTSGVGAGVQAVRVMTTRSVRVQNHEVKRCTDLFVKRY